MVSMATVTVTELKAKLSEKLRDVQRGEELLVTDHGNVVARIVPARDVEADRLALAKEGKLRLGTGKLPADLLATLRNAPGRASDAQPGADLLEALLEERREAR
jgi:prevent-host-death family protein